MTTRTSFCWIVTTVLLAGTLALSGLTARRIPEPLAIPLDRIDRQISGWTAFKEVALDPGALRSLDATSTLARLYRKGAMNLDLFIAFYAQQRAGESMHSPKHCLPGGGWEIWKHDSALVPVAGRKFEVNKYSIQNSGTRMLMFYWYQSKDRIIASEYMGKILLARDSLMTGHTAGSIVRIMLPDAPGASEEGIRFASLLIPQVERCFGSAGSLAAN
jgi:EpsI family protein